MTKILGMSLFFKYHQGKSKPFSTKERSIGVSDHYSILAPEAAGSSQGLLPT